jgi:adenylosuccinate synthase
MPAACIDRDVDVVFPAGSYIDLDVLFREIDDLDYPRSRIRISENANVISVQHKAWEKAAGLVDAIGSTGSGVGAAVMALTAREAKNFPLRALHARDIAALQQFLCDSTGVLNDKLIMGERVVIEGSQGFGLSLLDGGFWPKATARATTAAGALAEAGLSPLFVDNVTLVLRSFPIRVAGNSGPLLGETSWENVARRAGRIDDIREYTTVTKKLRRVGEFQSDLVRRSIAANSPNRIALNHLDYIDTNSDVGPSAAVLDFVSKIEEQIKHRIDWLGMSPIDCYEREVA